MTMKDVSAIDDLERAVRAEPALLTALDDRIEAQLGSEEVGERLDAGRALRAAATHDPALVAPYERTLVGLLRDDQDSLRLSGAVALAELATVAPERVGSATPELIAAFEATVAPTIEEAVLRALTRVGAEEPGTVAPADRAVAERLPGATFPIQTVITRSFVAVVAADPGLFERTIEAYATLVEDGPERTARFAVEALAAVARADPTAVARSERVTTRLRSLEAAIDADPRPGVGAGFKSAARTLRAVEPT